MKLSARAVTLIAGFIINGTVNLALAHQSIKLFDANQAFGTGVQTSPDRASPYASKSLILNFAPGDTAVISSTPDGKGPIVIDNFMTINGVNACEGVKGQAFSHSCFGLAIVSPLRTGLPIEAVLAPIPSIDVSRLIPVGTTTVQFDLRDFGVIAGNTDLFLVTTATVTPLQPPTAAHAFDAAMDLVTGQLRPVVAAAFQGAFEKQVSIPVLNQLIGRADGKTIAAVKQQLKQASIELASEAATAVSSLLNGQTLLSFPQRNLDKVFREPATAPTLIGKLVDNVGAPTIRINQSINDIVAHGFDPKRVDYDWKNISAETVIGQDVKPSPVFAEAKTECSASNKMGGEMKAGCKETIKTDNGFEFGLGVSVTKKPGGQPGTEVTATVSKTPDLSRAGIVTLLAVVIALGAFRRMRAASGAA